MLKIGALLLSMPNSSVFFFIAVVSVVVGMTHRAAKKKIKKSPFNFTFSAYLRASLLSH